MLTVLTFYWMNASWQLGDELLVARINQIANFLLIGKKDPVAEDVKNNLLFVNTSYDKMLVPFEDDYGSGTRAVADRKKLAALLKIINDAPVKPKLVLWDIFVDNPSDLDSGLYAEMEKLNPLVCSSYLETESKINRPNPNLHYALAQYETTTGSFLKYRIMLNDSMPYVPSALYSSLTGNTFHKTFGMVSVSNQVWLNSFIVDLPLRKSHIESNEIPLWNVGEALEIFSEEEIQASVANKLIVFGDLYEFDNHETLLGTQPGPMIVVNTYLALLKGLPHIRWSDVVILFGLYLFTTLYCLRLRNSEEGVMAKSIHRWKTGRFIMKYFSYLFVFFFLTIILYLFTGKHFQILPFAIYFNLFEIAVTWSRKRKRKMQLVALNEQKNKLHTEFIVSENTD
jgi:hypothetical protein